jgi:hypothetical protein
MLQAGFVKRIPRLNILVIKRTLDRYLKDKIGCVSWRFVGLEQALETINRQALWWKLRKKGSIEKMLEKDSTVKYCFV